MSAIFSVQGYNPDNTEDARRTWETLERSLKDHDTVEVQFTLVNSPARLRKEIYERFGGYEIKFLRLAYSSLRVLIGPEKVRTTAAAKPQSTITGTQKHPEELKRYREVPKDFAVAEDTKVCPVCNRRLALSTYYKRESGVAQSYCPECNRAYQKWRYELLKELRLERLTPDVTEGRRKRNEKFRAWFQTYQGE